MWQDIIIEEGQKHLVPFQALSLVNSIVASSDLGNTAPRRPAGQAAHEGGPLAGVLVAGAGPDAPAAAGRGPGGGALA